MTTDKVREITKRTMTWKKYYHINSQLKAGGDCQ